MRRDAERTGMRRRALLGAGAGALAAAAGCLDGIAGGGDDADDDDGTDDGGDDATDTPPHDTTTGSDSTYATFAPPSDAAHRLYVENLDDTAHPVDLAVRAVASGETVLAGRFEAPDGRGIEFPAVAARDANYEVRVALVDRDLAALFQWTARSCDGTEAPEGSRNGSVRIAEGATDLSFVVDACDALQAGAAVSTGPPGNFALDGYEPPAVTPATPERDCPPLLSVSLVDDPVGETVVDFEDVPPERQTEFQAALAADGDAELDPDSDYGFWVDEAQYVRYEGETYGVAVAVC